MFKLFPFSVLIFASILYAVHLIATQPPAPLSLEAPLQEFSASRAYQTLEDLLSENQPHPIGSPANQIIRAKIEAQLRDLGIPYRIQATWACRYQSNRCGYVENIVAELKGESELKKIALMAHYDSVPTSVGAGDDGMAVAAMLETARALLTHKVRARSVILLFTDGEEVGLLGAEAFFADAPEAENVDIVLNYEGSGTRGVSRLLRTSESNSALIAAFGRSAKPAIGNSLSNEIFKRMPNDTDFSVVQRHGISGLDFAFAEERSHYHTQNDNLSNISLATLQHHGNNMLPLVLELMQSPAPIQAPEKSVYTDPYGIFLAWSPSTQLPIVLIAIILLLVSVRLHNVQLQQLLLGSVLTFVSLSVSAILTLLIFKGLDWVNQDTPQWPANPAGFRLVMFAAPILITTAICMVMASKTNQIAATIGAWLWLAIITLACTLWLPDAANIWLVALVPATLTIVCSRFVKKKFLPSVLCLTLIGVVPATLGLFYPVESSQSYRLLPALVPSVSLFAMFWGALSLSRSLTPVLFFAGALTAVGASLAISQPLYSEHRPKPMNFSYYTNLDDNTQIMAAHTTGVMPDALLELADFNKTPRQLLPFSPATSSSWASLSVDPGRELAQPRLPGLRVTVMANNQKTVNLLISPAKRTSEVRFYWPKLTKLSSFSLDGKKFAAKEARASLDYNQLSIMGVYGRPVSLSMTFESNQPIPAFLVSLSTERSAFPEAFRAARNSTETSVHRGDQALSFRTIEL